MIAQEQETGKSYILPYKKECDGEIEYNNLQKFRKKHVAIRPLQKKSNEK